MGPTFKRNPDARFRSLLQKAIRRGNEALVLLTASYLQHSPKTGKGWLRSRAVVITFEECWPLGAQLIFNTRFHSKAAALVRVCRAVKTKAATGLGVLALALAEGDRSVLSGDSPSDRSIRIIADAVRRPDDYWGWVLKQPADVTTGRLIDNAYRFKNAGLPHDRAIIKAAVYLALKNGVPEVAPYACQATVDAFPYWIALDQHTADGKEIYREVARDLFLPPYQLEWIGFYLEGAQTSCDVPCDWWQRYLDWQFNKAGITPATAREIWTDARPRLEAALARTGHRLHKTLYAWQLEHEEELNRLTKEISLFNAHLKEAQQDQKELFPQTAGESS